MNAAQLLEQLGSPDAGRSLEELIKSSDPLKGAESLRLRSYFSSNCLEPSRDLDTYGRMLVSGDLDGIKKDFERRKESIATTGNPHAVTVNQLFSLRWGPTQAPIFNCLLLATMIWPDRREKVLDVVRWLALSIGVPVDGKDLSGTTALGHSLSTKPTLDLEFAQLLLNAGGNINNRNRYGATCAHDLCMVWSPNPASIERAKKALRFYLSHGGDPNITDNDGIAPITAMGVPWLSGLRQMTLDEERRRKQNGCAFCGSMKGEANAVPLMRCSRCKKAQYCAPPKSCQKADWARHKQECKE